jgi:hypothetical protein
MNLSLLWKSNFEMSLSNMTLAGSIERRKVEFNLNLGARHVLVIHYMACLAPLRLGVAGRRALLVNQ